MDQRSDLLQLLLQWLGSRGLIGVFSPRARPCSAGCAASTAPPAISPSPSAPLFVIAFVAPGLSELLGLGQEGAAMRGAILGMVARPLVEALMQLARALREDARALLRGWVSRRWTEQSCPVLQFGPGCARGEYLHQTRAAEPRRR